MKYYCLFMLAALFQHATAKSLCPKLAKLNDCEDTTVPIPCINKCMCKDMETPISQMPSFQRRNEIVGNEDGCENRIASFEASNTKQGGDADNQYDCKNEKMFIRKK